MREFRAGLTSLLQWIVLCLSLFILGAANTVMAQGDFGSVAGTIVESWEGKPLSGVTVTLRGTTLATTTDPQGRFSPNRVPPGEPVLRFSKAGYSTAGVPGVRAPAGPPP